MSNHNGDANKMVVRPIAWIVGKQDAPIFDEMATEVRIDDEAAGEFVLIKQHIETLEPGQIAIEPSDWPTLRKAIDDAVKQCRP